MKSSLIFKTWKCNYVYDCQPCVVFALHMGACIICRHLLIFDGGLCGTFIESKHIFHLSQSVNKAQGRYYRLVCVHLYTTRNIGLCIVNRINSYRVGGLLTIMGQTVGKF
jgi:hypothetical protein